MKHSQFLLLILPVALLPGVVRTQNRTMPHPAGHALNEAPGMDHRAFDRLLKKHV